MSETYLMLDIEVTGPISAYHSLIEFAFVYRDPVTDNVTAFDAALKGFYNMPWHWDSDTYEWWHMDSRKETLKNIERDAKDPIRAMTELEQWITRNDFQNATVVAFGCDYEWIKLYWWKVFKAHPPFGLLAVDAKSFAMPVLGIEFHQTHNSTLRRTHPELFIDDLPHTHRALDDALEQSLMFNKILEMAKSNGIRIVP